MTIHYQGHGVTLHHGDCLDVLRTLPDASVDSVVTDPPYGLEFMGKDWDSFRPDVLVNRGAGSPGRAAWDETKMSPVEYGGAKQRSTLTCDGCGKSDKFKNPHECPDGTGWSRVNLDTKAARVAYAQAFQQWCELWATECLRVLKPGGHLLAFGGTRTWHRLACAVEDAGFEVRDSIAWMYGSGFPKSLDVSKAIDKAAGAEREVVGNMADISGRTVGKGLSAGYHGDIISGHVRDITAPATDAAREWAGWGTALKPAFEPVVVARKPLAGTVAANVLEHGTGALNIDGCRVGDGGQLSWAEPRGIGYMGGGSNAGAVAATENAKGRWPANVVLDEEMARRLDEQSGEQRDGTAVKRNRSEDGRAPYDASSYMITDRSREDHGYGGQGGASRFFPASRFFYVAKAPTSERPRYKREGGSDNATTYGQMKKRECNVCGNRTCPAGGEQSGKPWPTCGHDDWSWVEQQSARDEFVAHPTVKPLSLMRWLVRLVTPPGGTVLEPFAGSGTTVEACIVEGFDCIAIEKGEEYLPLITQRIHRQRNPVEAIRQTGADLGLFELDGEGA